MATDHRARQASVMEQVLKFGRWLGKIVLLVDIKCGRQGWGLYLSSAAMTFIGTFLFMAFSRSLSTNAMAPYVAYHFEWDRCGVAFSRLSLPNDFQALCLSYELDVAEEATQCFELPELPQVIFYAMLLNEAERLGVVHGRMLCIMESALTELRLSTFKAWILEARFCEEAEQKKESSNTKGAASPSDNDKQERERTREKGEERELCTPPSLWRFLLFMTQRDGRLREGRRATCPPHPLPDDYQDLCSCFTLSDAERAVLNYQLPEMVQSTFYAMLLNDAVELGIRENIGGIEEKERERRKMLRLNPLSADYHDLCPGFDLGVATQCTQDSNIPEMVQAIFYVMVVIDVRQMAKTKSTPRIRTPNDLLAEGTLEGNIRSTASLLKPRVEVLPAHSSSSSTGTFPSSSDEASANSSDDGSSSRSSSCKALTSSSMQAGPMAPGRAVLKKRGRTTTELVPEVPSAHGL
ncbi:hypothetical protein Cgig2_000452 [Carnegiea gigantea]|uniref:Uncharacterized protein n=1 Tax=Carnegiea gigantea TaxID=171969 RepID=A0A9Q1QBX4_9CARY|nr:hypothetical protein Cgig2_000452 [Carnegiea gigantea]